MQKIGLRHEVDLVEDGDGRPLHLGEMVEEGCERLVEPAMGIDDKGHDIGVARPVPGGLRHGAVESPLRLKDARRIDEDDLGVADERDAAHRPARRLRLVGDDGDLGADQRIGEGRLAAIRRTDQRHEAAPGLFALVRLGAGARHLGAPPTPLRAATGRAQRPARRPAC